LLTFSQSEVKDSLILQSHILLFYLMTLFHDHFLVDIRLSANDRIMHWYSGGRDWPSKHSCRFYKR